MKIFEYIKKLDESGNYRLADKLDNEIRKIYAQAIQQTPGMQSNHMLNPNFAFILNQLLMKEQSKMTNKNKETDTLSPTKKYDPATTMKQLNNLSAQVANLQRDNKKTKANQDTLPVLEGKIGKATDQFDELGKKITNNTNDIADNTFDIEMLQDSIDTLEK